MRAGMFASDNASRELSSVRDGMVHAQSLCKDGGAREVSAFSCSCLASQRQRRERERDIERERERER